MKTVHKYELDFLRGVLMPQGAEILSVQIQNEVISARLQNKKYCLWASVDTDKPSEIRHFERIGTGWDMVDTDVTRTHLASLQDGEFVWHIFELE